MVCVAKLERLFSERGNLSDMAVIYRIRNRISGKCYIGESKRADPFSRWREHQRNIERSIGCPALRDAVQKYGVENFVFEVMIFCFDEDRFHYERQYIQKYNTQVPNGYNLTPGGEGGGFVGKTHTPETIAKIKSNLQKYYKNPINVAQHRISVKEAMKQVNMSEIMRNSENFKKAVQEGRVGAAGRKITKTKEEQNAINKKVSETLKEYYKKNSGKNIEKSRESMAKAKGVHVEQYTKEGVFVASFQSIADAARSIDIAKSSIRYVLNKPDKLLKGFLWKRLKKDLV